MVKLIKLCSVVVLVSTVLALPAAAQDRSSDPAFQFAGKAEYNRPAAKAGGSDGERTPGGGSSKSNGSSKSGGSQAKGSSEETKAILPKGVLPETGGFPFTGAVMGFFLLAGGALLLVRGRVR